MAVAQADPAEVREAAPAAASAAVPEEAPGAVPVAFPAEVPEGVPAALACLYMGQALFVPEDPAAVSEEAPVAERTVAAPEAVPEEDPAEAQAVVPAA